MPKMLISEKSCKSLQDIADIVGGQIMTRVTSKTNDAIEIASVLMPKAIIQGGIIRDYLGEALLSKRVSKDKYTKEGDVIIKLASPYDAAAISIEEEGLLIPSFCAAIRIIKSEYMNAKYLAAFLNSSYVRNILSLVASGVSRPMIKISDIRSLKVPNVPFKEMKEIGEAYILSSQKKMILQEMIRAEENLMENIVLSSIKGGIGRE